MLLDYALTAFVTLVVVVDPIGIAPAFLSVTQDIPQTARRGVGFRAALIAALILAGTALIGNWLLSRLGIGLPAFRISGGILLFVIAFEMVLGVRPAREARQAERAIEEHARNIAAFPLAIPLIAGPGAITATLLLAGQTADRALFLAALVGIIAVVWGLSRSSLPLAQSRSCSRARSPVSWALQGILCFHDCSAWCWPPSPCSS